MTTLIETTEDLLDQFVIIIKIIIEAIAILIIAFAVLKALTQMWQRRKNMEIIYTTGNS